MKYADESSALRDAVTDAFPASPEHLLKLLAALDIGVEHHHHVPLRTVEDSRRYRGDMTGGHAKNLYLRDRKKRNYLVVAEEDQPIDLKKLALALDTDRLSFGSADRLMEFLGVVPGAVTPFAVINDPHHRVSVFLDEALATMDKVNFHPLINDQTVTIAIADLMRFFAHTGHEVTRIDLRDLADAAS